MMETDIRLSGRAEIDAIFSTVFLVYVLVKQDLKQAALEGALLNLCSILGLHHSENITL